jgi:uncharacterized protein YidB (DUF937 family)
MSGGYPSMTALLGLLALAGYQNRDRIAEMLRGADRGAAGRTGAPPAAGADQVRADGILADIGKSLGAGGAGGFLGGGLGQLVDHFRQNGHGEAADSWVRQGPNRDLAPQEVRQALGPDLLEALAQRTGLSHDELTSRLSRTLPDAVDRYTPGGMMPAR